MGQDIHCAVERWSRDGWKTAGPLRLHRNYDMFRILKSLAGPSPRRGLPTDADPESCCRENCGSEDASCDQIGHDLGDHSHSWLTLAELRSHDWDQLMPQQGYVPLRDVDRSDSDYETYVSWSGAARAAGPDARRRAPHGYCGSFGAAQILDLRGPDAGYDYTAADRSSPDRVTRECAERYLSRLQDLQAADRALADRLLADPSLMPEPEAAPAYRDRLPGSPRPRTAWALVSWTTAARDICGTLCAWIDSCDGDDGDGVRIVFGFDS